MYEGVNTCHNIHSVDLCLVIILHTAVITGITIIISMNTQYYYMIKLINQLLIIIVTSDETHCQDRKYYNIQN